MCSWTDRYFTADAQKVAYYDEGTLGAAPNKEFPLSDLLQLSIEHRNEFVSHSINPRAALRGAGTGRSGGCIRLASSGDQTWL